MSVPEPTTVSSAILFHCATVFPGGSAAAASRAVPADAATDSATTAIATTRRTRARIRTSVLGWSMRPPFFVGRATPIELFLLLSGRDRLHDAERIGPRAR